MNIPPLIDEPISRSMASAGDLPPADRIQVFVQKAYEQFKSVDEGQVADYIPALAQVPRHLFGICVVGVHGEICTAGDTEREFSIQSLLKPFLFALICQRLAYPVRVE